MAPQEKEAQLISIISKYKSVVVAFSGGVDSSYLAFITHRVLGDAATSVTALSPSVSKQQKHLVEEFVKKYALYHRYIETREMEDPNYIENPSNRCYFCKSELFTVLDGLKEKWDVDAVFDGSNTDDLSDYRPGRKAADEGNVVSPLIEAGFTKDDIRIQSKAWGLPTWDLPAMPCLSSRLPYGVEVTPEKLDQIEKAEEFIRSLNFKQFRVRHHESLARIEIASNELQKILDLELFEKINQGLKKLGYSYVTVDLQGFRSGALNELLELDLGSSQ